MECPKPLLRIVRSCRFIDQLADEVMPAPDFDLHCPLLSLPGLLKTTLESVPGRGALPLRLTGRRPAVAGEARRTGRLQDRYCLAGQS